MDRRAYPIRITELDRIKKRIKTNPKLKQIKVSPLEHYRIARCISLMLGNIPIKPIWKSRKSKKQHWEDAVSFQEMYPQQKLMVYDTEIIRDW